MISIEANGSTVSVILRNLDAYFDWLWDIAAAQCTRTIESYYRGKGVEVGGSLAEDLQKDNFKTLRMWSTPLTTSPVSQ